MAGIPDDAVRETWTDAYDKSLKLAEIIEAHCRQSGEQFDVMIVVPRGSYYPANIISRQLGFEAVDLLQASVGSYQPGTTDRRPEFQVGQMPSREQVAGKDLLIIEEVCETGHTLQFLTDRLKEQGARRIRTGVLHYKPDRSQTGFVPDWFVDKTDKWVVYPWEVNEESGRHSVVKRSS